MFAKVAAYSEVATVVRRLRVGDRVPRARILGDRGEESRLRGVERACLVVEVDPRCLFDPVRAVAEINRVQVGGQDPVLRPALLELPGECRLEELASDRFLAGQIGVLDELLRDRRAALDGAPVRDVCIESTRHAAQVDATMLVEALVLGGDDRVLHPWRDPSGRHDDSRLLAAKDREHGVPVRRIDIAVRLLLLARRVELRDLGSDRGQQTDGERCRAQQPEDHQEGEESELADPPTLGSARFSPEGRQNRGSVARP